MRLLDIRIINLDMKCKFMPEEIKLKRTLVILSPQGMIDGIFERYVNDTDMKMRTEIDAMITKHSNKLSIDFIPFFL